MRRHTVRKQGYQEFNDNIIRPSDTLSNRSAKNRLSRVYSQDDGFHADQFKESNLRTKTPWKAIGLATFLFIGGTISLVVCILSLAGHMNLPKDVPTALLVLGLLMFVPGFYHVRIAYWAYQECPGYTFDDLMNLNDY